MKIEEELQNALRLNSKDKVNYVFEKIYNDYFKLGMYVIDESKEENHIFRKNHIFRRRYKFDFIKENENMRLDNFDFDFVS